MTTPAEKALRAILDNLQEHADDLPPIPAVCELWAQGSEALKKIKPTCPECGSEQVGVDANASWDEKAQWWELGGSYDAGFCSMCEADDRDLVWVDIDTPTPPVDLIDWDGVDREPLGQCQHCGSTHDARDHFKGNPNITDPETPYLHPEPVEPHLILLMEAMFALEVAGAALGHVPTPDSPDPDHPVNRYMNLGGEGYNAYDMARSKAIDINRYLKAHEADRDNVVQAVAIQRAQAYLKRASWTPRPGPIEQALREGIRLARDVAGRVNPDDALLDTLKDWCDNTEIDVLAAGKLTEQEISDVIVGAASAETEPVEPHLALLMEAVDALKSATYQSQTHLARKIDAHLKSLD